MWGPFDSFTEETGEDPTYPEVHRKVYRTYRSGKSFWGVDISTVLYRETLGRRMSEGEGSGSDCGRVGWGSDLNVTHPRDVSGPSRHGWSSRSRPFHRRPGGPVSG